MYYMSASVYRQRSNDFQQQAKKLSAQLSLMSTVRLLCFAAAVVCGWYCFKTGNLLFLLPVAVLLTAFFILIRQYDKKSAVLNFTQSLAVINQNEADFIEQNKHAYDNGADHTNPQHAYSYDIDLFGEHSLFHFLNRTASLFGKKALADVLTAPDIAAIIARQAAIAELKDKLDYRHQLHAHGLNNPVSRADYDQVTAWLNTPNTVYGRPILRVLLFVLPIAFVISILLYIGDYAATGVLATGLFILNLSITGRYFANFKQHLSASEQLSKSLLQLAQQLNVIEKEKFNSPLLQQLQQQLTSNQSAGNAIHQLARLFSNLDSIYNLPASMMLNGIMLFHLHIFYGIEKWKTAQKQQLHQWLAALGAAEALNSLGNFACNNPGFVFPQLSDTEDLAATALGHPLIGNTKRTCNDVSLRHEKFIILTGSNMSGKSTFLRTLAVNMVLARAGSVVCARGFSFYPYDIFVSMRISDSLLDNESFFYAELKRLQHIIHYVQSGHKTFVLLDEILRGTNSNDKHGGTVGLIKKLAAMKVCGIIATHDVTIGELSSQYAGYMTNKCFEAQITNDELLFDYKLKDGVCQKLSASFLMKKMEIID
jgi:ABC-type multidrug transport system fused ATPase/permease subunit